MGTASPAVSKDVQEAFRATCYAKGIEDLAPLMGLSPGVLYNKCNAHETSHHKPTLKDAVVVQVVTGDKRLTHAIARLMGGVFIDLAGVTAEGADSAVLDLVVGWMKEQGELFASFQRAYADGEIDAQDVRAIKREAYDVLQAILGFVARVERLQT